MIEKQFLNLLENTDFNHSTFYSTCRSMWQYLTKVMFMFVECIAVEEEFELCLPDGEVTVHGAVGASELINTAKSGSESGV